MCLTLMMTGGSGTAGQCSFYIDMTIGPDTHNHRLDRTCRGRQYGGAQQHGSYRPKTSVHSTKEPMSDDSLHLLNVGAPERQISATGSQGTRVADIPQDAEI